MYINMIKINVMCLDGDTITMIYFGSLWVTEFRSKDVKYNTGMEDLISFVLDSMYAWAVIGYLYYALNTLEDAPVSNV